MQSIGETSVKETFFSIHTHNLKGTKQKYWQKAAACFVIKTIISDINIDHFARR